MGMICIVTMKYSSSPKVMEQQQEPEAGLGADSVRACLVHAISTKLTEIYIAFLHTESNVSNST